MLNLMMSVKKSRIIVRIIYSFILLFACYITVSFITDVLFVNGGLERWADAAATVTKSEVSGETLALNNDSDSVRGDRVYKSYTVRYTYTAEFEAWGRVFSFEYEGSNSGKTDQHAKKAPDTAYDFPKQGETVLVIYDPGVEGSYRIGSKEEWRQKGAFSLGNVIVPCIMLFVAAAFIAIDSVTAKKRRKGTAGAQSGAHSR